MLMTGVGGAGAAATGAGGGSGSRAGRVHPCRRSGGGHCRLRRHNRRTSRARLRSRGDGGRPGLHGGTGAGCEAGRLGTAACGAVPAAGGSTTGDGIRRAFGDPSRRNAGRLSDLRQALQRPAGAPPRPSSSSSTRRRRDHARDHENDRHAPIIRSLRPAGRAVVAGRLTAGAGVGAFATGRRAASFAAASFAAASFTAASVAAASTRAASCLAAASSLAALRLPRSGFFPRSGLFPGSRFSGRRRFGRFSCGISERFHLRGRQVARKPISCQGRSRPRSFPPLAWTRRRMTVVSCSETREIPAGMPSTERRRHSARRNSRNEWQTLQARQTQRARPLQQAQQERQAAGRERQRLPARVRLAQGGPAPVRPGRIDRRRAPPVAARRMPPELRALGAPRVKACVRSIRRNAPA